MSDQKSTTLHERDAAILGATAAIAAIAAALRANGMLTDEQLAKSIVDIENGFIEPKNSEAASKVLRHILGVVQE